jgi:hypothetical protein
MLHDFLDVDKSPLLSLSKKGLAKASFAVTIGMVSLAAGTGLLPITVAGVSNTQVASAGDRVIAQGSNGCAYYRMHEAWWGQYLYLNKCAALQMAGQYGVTTAVIRYIAEKTPGVYRAPVSLAAFYGGSLSTSLYVCAANNGQAYIRFYKTGPSTVLPYVSCN